MVSADLGRLLELVMEKIILYLLSVLLMNMAYGFTKEDKEKMDSLLNTLTISETLSSNKIY